VSDLVVTERQRMRLDGEAVATLLYRRDVAMARHRSALGRSLGLSDVEVGAVMHLARERELTTARLAALLDLSSGGATALVQRLERLDIAARRPHPGDRRSSLIRLTPQTASAIARAESVLSDGIREKLASMNDGARSAVAGFLTRLVELSEELTADRDATARPQGGLVSRPVPSLWG
jgi:DNA-binding MarR family transcriptional regulator